jgi:predicted nucleic acid-binding protein
MIIFDASFLIVYLHPSPEPAKDRDNKLVSQFRERVDHLIATLNVADQVIGVPAPALAEILVRAGKGRFKYLSILSDSYRFEIIPFGMKAAIEAGELIAQIKNENKSQPWATWAKVKFDIQIASIGKAEPVTAIYSDDTDIESLGKRLKLKVIRICDLPLPPAPDPKRQAEEQARRETGLLFPEAKKDETEDGKTKDSVGLQADSAGSTGDKTGSKEAKQEEAEKPKPAEKGGLGESDSKT